MAELRRLHASNLANQVFTSFGPSEAEIDEVQRCLLALIANPLIEHPVLFNGYGGNHHFIECSRFLLIYQFSDQEVRVKDVRLRSKYP